MSTTRLVALVLGLLLILPLLGGIGLVVWVQSQLPPAQSDRVRGPHDLVGVQTGGSYAWVVPGATGVVLIDAGLTEQDEHLRYIGCVADTVVDLWDDGVVDSTSHREYDHHGWTALYEVHDETGLLTFRETTLNDVFGNDLLRETDTDGDGDIDETTTGEYDADGNPVRVLVDNIDGDGIDDLRYSYESADGLLRTGRLRALNEGLVYLEEDYTYTYDGLDRLVVLDEFARENGLLDWRTAYTWHDQSDRVATWRGEDWWGDDFRGALHIDYEYDDRDRLVTFDQHTESPSVYDPVEVWEATYVYEGAAPEPSSAEQVQSTDGIEHTRLQWAWTYDAAWRTTELVADEGREMITWECP